MTKDNLKILRCEILLNVWHLQRHNPPPPPPDILFLKEVTASRYREQ